MKISEFSVIDLSKSKVGATTVKRRIERITDVTSLAVNNDMNE